MGKVWDYIEQHRRSFDYPVSVRSIALAAKISPTTVDKWKDIRRMPEPRHLAAMARQIKVPYHRFLDAALHDAGYLPEEAANGTQAQAEKEKTRGGVSPSRPLGVVADDLGVTKDPAPLRARPKDQDSDR